MTVDQDGRGHGAEPGAGSPPGTVASHSVESFLLKLLHYGLGFGASVLVSRGLGVEGRGIYYLPVVTAATTVALSNLGVEQANIYLVGTRRVAFERLWAQGSVIAVLMGSLGLAAMLCLPSIARETYQATPASLLWLAGLGVPFSLHILYTAGLLTLRGDVTWQFRVSVAAALVQGALLFVLFFTAWFTPTSVLGVSLASTMLTWFLIARRFAHRGFAWIRWDTRLLGDTLRQALPLHLGMVFLFLHLRADMFMVQGMLGTAALGQYSLAVTLAETVLLATDSLAVALIPRQVGNTLEEAATTALRGVRTNLLLGAGLASVWVVLGFPILRLAFGAAFTPAYVPLVALLPGLVFSGLQRVCGATILRAGAPGRVATIQGSSLLCNIILNRLWIPTWGLLGAGLASTVSYGLGAIVFVFWASRLGRTSFFRAALPGRSDVATLQRAVLVMVGRRGV